MFRRSRRRKHASRYPTDCMKRFYAILCPVVVGRLAICEGWNRSRQLRITKPLDRRRSNLMYRYNGLPCETCIDCCTRLHNTMEYLHQILNGYYERSCVGAVGWDVYVPVLPRLIARIFLVMAGSCDSHKMLHRNTTRRWRSSQENLLGESLAISMSFLSTPTLSSTRSRGTSGSPETLSRHSSTTLTLGLHCGSVAQHRLSILHRSFVNHAPSGPSGLIGRSPIVTISITA